MTVDYSKIDFTKCKLEPLGDLPIDVTSTKIAVSICSAETGVTMLRKEIDSVWHTNQGALYLGREWVNDLFDRGDTVDAFIAAETARIEAEENAANWVQVPWQDATWLQTSGAKLRVFLFPDSKEPKLVSWSLSGDRLHEFLFEADRRTFPAGYDPTMPRWVEVKMCDVLRLERAGIACYTRLKSDCCAVVWSPRRSDYLQSGINREYAIDIHTLPPGVPLHVEPKPEPRPCTKGFALSHLDESQARVRSGSQWGNWVSVGVFDYVHDISSYEFRTTAKEEPSVPRLPTVKLPDGCCWEIIPLLGVCAVDDDGRHRHITQVFASERQRRIDAACEAAFQELYGE